jgi:hypothetical protein
MWRTEWTRSNVRDTLRGMGVLPHVKKLNDALGQFQVQITCKWVLSE